MTTEFNKEHFLTLLRSTEGTQEERIEAIKTYLSNTEVIKPSLLNPNIIVLDLSGKGINDTDAVGALAALLHSAININALALSNNGINDVETVHALAGLPHSIKTLYLDNNDINDVEMVGALAGLPHSIKTLYLSINGINDAETIAALAELPHSINTLYLGYNGINDTCTQSLITLLQQRPQIISLNLIGNYALSEESLAQINEQLRANYINQAFSVFTQWAEKSSTPIPFNNPNEEIPPAGISPVLQAVLSEKENTAEKLDRVGELRTVSQGWRAAILAPAEAAKQLQRE
jgi:hypothetical protein